MATPEPTPYRDLGPYESRGQVLAQIHAQLHGIPDPGPGGRAALLLAEAFVLAGIADTLTDYERAQATDIARVVGPVAAQQIAAWIVRARLKASPPLMDDADRGRYQATAVQEPKTAPDSCCEFHDHGDKPCSATGPGGYCCERCPDVVATAPKPAEDGDA